MTPSSVSGLRDAGRAEEVDLDGEVERRVERDRGGGVDDDVAARRAPRVRRRRGRGRRCRRRRRPPAPAGRPSRRRPPCRRARSRSRSKQSFLKISRCGPLLDGAHAARPDEQHELAVGHRPQQPLDQGGAQEAGGAGDGDALAGQVRRGSRRHRSELSLPFGRCAGRLVAAVTDGPTTRERVLEAALSSFAHRGYEATSLDELAAELGVRKQTILYYYPSKEALLGAVDRRSVAELAGVLRAAGRRGVERGDPLQAVVDAAFRLGRAPSRAARARARGDAARSSCVDAASRQSCRPCSTSWRRRRPRGRRSRAAAMVVGMATEVEVLRGLGVAPDPGAAPAPPSGAPRLPHRRLTERFSAWC